jgi:signal peptidase I
MKNFWSELFELLLIFVFIFLPIRLFIFEPFIVIGESMEPNFHNSDYLIVCKICVKLKEPTRGEVIVFVPPVDSKKYYIKRIIGLPNEKIIIRNNHIYIINGKNPQGFTLNENYLKNLDYTMEDMEYQLGPNEYFVLGDNRDESFDSRKWDRQLTKDKIVGKVIFRISFLGKFINILRFNI